MSGFSRRQLMAMGATTLAGLASNKIPAAIQPPLSGTLSAASSPRVVGDHPAEECGVASLGTFMERPICNQTLGEGA